MRLTCTAINMGTGSSIISPEEKQRAGLLTITETEQKSRTNLVYAAFHVFAIFCCVLNNAFRPDSEESTVP